MKKFKKIATIVLAVIIMMSLTISSSAYSSLNNDEIRSLQLSNDDDVLKIQAQKEMMLNRRINYPSSYSVAMNWEQQVNNYYCGPATAKILLDCTSTPTTQNDIAIYLKTTIDGTPWFSGASGMETAGQQYYNMMYGLNQWQYYKTGRIEWSYMVYPYNGESVSATGYFDRIKSTTYIDYGVAAYIVSQSSNKFHSNYPSTSVHHWVACYGWTGNYIRICDPASGISGFSSVPTKYNVSSDKFASCAWGIVY